MKLTTKPLLTRKRWIYRADLAVLLEVSVDVVRKNEKRLGLDKARRDINPRVVRYDYHEAMEILYARHLISM